MTPDWVPPKPVHQDDKAKMVVHLASGHFVTVWMDVGDQEPEEVIDKLAEQITEAGRPHWLALENVLVYTGAVSAIEVL